MTVSPMALGVTYQQNDTDGKLFIKLPNISFPFSDAGDLILAMGNQVQRLRPFSLSPSLHAHAHAGTCTDTDANIDTHQLPTPHHASLSHTAVPPKRILSLSGPHGQSDHGSVGGGARVRQPGCE